MTMSQAFKYSDRLDLAHDGAVDGARRSGTLGRCRCAHTGSAALAQALGATFNQSAALAGAISALCGVPVAHSGLKRVRATPQQVGRSKTERAENVQGAFVVPAEHRPDITGPAPGIGR